jgi:GTP-binding protein
VLSKALEAKLKPIVVINKIDRPDARPQEVLNEVYDLFIDLDADESQLDFPVLYTNGKLGTATTDLASPAPTCSRSSSRSSRPSRRPAIPRAAADPGHQPRLLRLPRPLAIGRVFNGTLKHRRGVNVSKIDGTLHQAQDHQALHLLRPQAHRHRRDEVGDIVAIAGVPASPSARASATLENPQPLPLIVIDEPTIAIQFNVNNSPFAGREGKFVTSRNLRERLEKNCSPTSPFAWKTPARRTASRCSAAANCSSPSSSK